MSYGEKDIELCDIAAVLVKETKPAEENAGAFLINDGTREVWVPKSLTQRNSDGTFTLPEWLAKEKGLI